MVMLVAPIEGEVVYAAAGVVGIAISWLAKQYISERDKGRAREDRLYEQARVDSREMLTAIHANTAALAELRTAVKAGAK